MAEEAGLKMRITIGVGAEHECVISAGDVLLPIAISSDPAIQNQLIIQPDIPGLFLNLAEKLREFADELTERYGS